MLLSSFQVGGANICNYEYAVYIENETVAYDTGPLFLLSGFRLEFTVSTEDSGVTYDSKYQTTIEGNGAFNASTKFPLSKCHLYTKLVSSLVSRLFTICNDCMTLPEHETKCLYIGCVSSFMMEKQLMYSISGLHRCGRWERSMY